MRLINVHTFELEEHISPPPYAILSHTWRDGEVLFAEYGSGDEKNKPGYRKIINLCAQAAQHDIGYVWMDTVCIDKSSSAELSEAINSMFSWYQNAEVCYVYLDDVNLIADIPNSRWITRAWTLQELIAPYDVFFFTKNWSYLGTKQSLIASLVDYTGIEQFVLENPFWITDISVAGRMSWAAKRKATRIEDIAYCLFGIFDVNLPLLYGEGKKAFQRLQHEILRQSQDLTILAFERTLPADDGPILFAESPSSFNSSVKIVNETKENEKELTSEGLQVSLQTLRDSQTGRYWINLGCRFEFDRDNLIAVSVRRHTRDGYKPYWVMQAGPLEVLPRKTWEDISHQNILLSGHPPPLSRLSYNDTCRNLCALKADNLISHGFKLICTNLEDGLGSWNGDAMISEVVTTNPVLVRKFGFMHVKHKEAFIVGVVDAAIDSSTIKRLFLSVKVKPEDKDCETWLSDEGIYNTIKPLSEKQGKEFVYQVMSGNPYVDGVSWYNISTVSGEGEIIRSTDNIELLSRSCFEWVTVRTKIHSYKPGYALHFSTGFHAGQV